MQQAMEAPPPMDIIDMETEVHGPEKICDQDAPSMSITDCSDPAIDEANVMRLSGSHLTGMGGSEGTDDEGPANASEGETTEDNPDPASPSSGGDKRCATEVACAVTDSEPCAEPTAQRKSMRTRKPAALPPGAVARMPSRRGRNPERGMATEYAGRLRTHKELAESKERAAESAAGASSNAKKKKKKGKKRKQSKAVGSKRAASRSPAASKAGKTKKKAKTSIAKKGAGAAASPSARKKAKTQTQKKKKNTTSVTKKNAKHHATSKKKSVGRPKSPSSAAAKRGAGKTKTKAPARGQKRKRSDDDGQGMGTDGEASVDTTSNGSECDDGTSAHGAARKSKKARTNKAGQEKLSVKNAHLKYKARLGTIPAEKWAVLDGAWISVQSPALRARKTFKPGVFPAKWMRLLHGVAQSKGASIVGVLPHYGSPVPGAPGLRKFEAMPGLVERGMEAAYRAAEGCDWEVEGGRVYVGPPKKTSAQEGCAFAFGISDTLRDEFWEALEQVLTEENGQPDA